jgi:hypothetical protein
MSAIAFDTVLNEALVLPFEQRSFLGTQCIASLEEDEDGINPAWTSAALQRSEAMTNRSVTPLSLEAFKTQIESRIHR